MSYDKEKLTEELRRDEGLRLLPYMDSEAIWSIGIGRNLEAKGIPFEILIELLQEHGLNENQVNRILEDDIAEAEADLDSLYPSWQEDFSDNRKRALVNMAFNLGRTKLRKFRKMWVAINLGDWQDAAREALDSKWAVQVGVRSQRIAALLEDT